MLSLLFLLGPSSGLGALIAQQPSRDIWKKGSSALIHCQQIDSQLTFMYWYLQLPQQSLVLIATANKGTKASYEKEFDEAKFLINRPDTKSSTLEVIDLDPKDSGIYFCSAS
uniref:Ig-like domain-containing protein n=1 Tax=Sarcophilus harrisii TaxID=9305 RepID=G3VXS7_SARHA